MKNPEIPKHNIERLQAISGFLKEYRINSGYSQQELSECANIHRNTIIGYEGTNSKNLTLITIFKIADTLELDLNQLFLEIK